MNGLYAGLTSSSHLDGIDVALVEIAAGRKASLRSFQTVPFEEELREQLLLLTRGAAVPGQIALADTRVGAQYGEALMQAMRHVGARLSELQAVGSQGLILWRISQDEDGHGNLQVGAAAEIAARAGCAVVADFAAGDMAVGGRGAPLAAVFHRDCFASKGRGVALLHIGSMAGLTYIDPQGECVLSFDTGPGNKLIDALMRKHFQRALDANGAMAASGKVSEAFLAELLHHAFFAQLPPKVVGQGDFDELYVEDFLRRARWWGLSPADQVATATALTLRSMADAYRRFVLPRGRVDEVIISGGGALSAGLFQGLVNELRGIKVSKVEDYGFATQSVKAASFAYLAFLRMAGLTGNIPAATGATQAVVLGALTDLRPENRNAPKS